MRISDVRTHVLLDPGYDVDATSSAQDTVVVEIETDEGLTGIGETDLNAWIARACIEAPGTHTMDRGLRQMLLGRDPLDPVSIWQELYVGTAMTGRRGALINALGAIDIALWDLAGKAAGTPSWRLLGEQARDHLTPYASLQPEVASFDAYVDLDGRLGDEGTRPRLHRRQARGHVRRALRAQGPARPGRVDRRGRARRARGRGCRR